MSTPSYAGIDVSQDKLDVCVTAQKEVRTYARTEQGLVKLAKYLKQHQVCLVVVEATGALERMVVRHLMGSGIPTSVVNPRQMRCYARGAGVIAKTDPLDARVMEQFARERRPEPRALPSREEQVLKDLRARRGQLMKMRIAEQSRLSRAEDGTARASIRRVMKTLHREMAAIEERFDEVAQSSQQCATTRKLISSVKCVGAKTARSVLAEMPEIGKLDSKQVACLGGLAPFDDQSGKRKGAKIIQGGRGAVRSALYMATLSATRFNPDISKFYNRLLKAGKARMVALVACMRKLLIIINAVVARGTAWTAQRP